MQLTAQVFIDVAEDEWKRRLRQRPPAPTPTIISRPSNPKKTKNPKRVLIVEDDIDSARSLLMLVEDMGHTADYVINGYVAMEHVRRFRPDVVFLDIGLPDLNGFEVCKLIKDDPELKHTRVIVVTGYAHDEYRIRSSAAGCELHLIKPVPASVFEHVLG
jgi:CheY-like chemotaxis protein